MKTDTILDKFHDGKPAKSRANNRFGPRLETKKEFWKRVEEEGNDERAKLVYSNLKKAPIPDKELYDLLMWECQPDGELKEKPYVELEQDAGEADSGSHCLDALDEPQANLEARPVDYEQAEITENYKRDLRWVYTNYTKHVQQKDSPSPGAWGLRKWAEGNSNGFFTLCSKILTTDKTKDDQKHEDDKREVFAVLKKAGINL